ncbi:hypothetical protein BGZ90_003032 [Linnemannia elongata]|nr:hypothetical protein BGZ90_003032 [Linnemannia elongata]
MDTLIYPPAAPIPLILPRSLSFQAGSSDLYKGSSRTRKSSFTTEQGSSPPSTSPLSIGASTHQQEPLRRQSTFTFPASTSLPVTYTFLPPSSSKSNPSPTLVRSQIRRQRRRHSVTGGGFAWTTTSTTLPPRHALHMPIMKISPLVRRREQHQRNIHRLMHEGREVEVMRRRGVATVMDTSEEGDEEEEEGMAGVVFTGTSIQQQQQTQSALDERAQMQAKQEFALLVAESSKAYQEILQQQQHQRNLAAAAVAEEQRRRNSWPKQQQLQVTGGGGISYANQPLTFQQQQHQQQAYLQQQQKQQQRLIQLQQEQQRQQHHQRQLQFQEQKQFLLLQQQQLQQQIQQQQFYKQRMHATSSPSLNLQARFSPPQQQQVLHVQGMQTPQERGANAISMAKTMNQNNAATTASNWNYTAHHATSTGRLSLY